MMDSRPVIDLSAALNRFDGDHELFLILAGMFVEGAAQTLATIHKALAAQDLPLLAKEAHKLKGSAMEFCAHPAVAAAAQLEASARQAAVQDVVALSERVHAETQRLADELKGIIERGFPS